LFLLIGQDRRTRAAAMADADDYESLPQTSSMTTHMLAGAAAGIMEHCVMYPVDCVKVGIHEQNAAVA